MSELGGTINERIGDLRNGMGISQTELSERTGIPKSAISRIESGKTMTIGHDVLAKLAQFFNVSADYLLGLTDVRMRKNVDVGRLGFSDRALYQLTSGKINMDILNLLLENKNFPRFLDYAEEYFDGANEQAYLARNDVIDFGIHALREYASETPKVRLEALHDINRMNAEKISYNEAALTKLRDMMMGIIKDIKASYDAGLPTPAGEANITEMMNAMFEQVKQAKEEKGDITAEDIADVVVEYVKRSNALNEEAAVQMKELCLEVLGNTEQ